MGLGEDMRILALWIINMFIQIFGIIAIVIRHYSTIAWWIMTGLQFACLIVLICVGINHIIVSKKEYKGENYDE